VLEQNPNPKVVTNADLLARIQATGLPWRVKDKSAGIEMLLVPPGKFIMGASPGDTEATDEEKPAHEVTLTKPFYLGRTEITQAQWYKVTGEEAGHFKLSSEHPVESVTFENVNNFLKKAGNGLGLPTEAQWEYCCRAGTKGAAYSDLDSIAWYSNNSKNTTHAVAQALANELGFYDMLGNVSEWCSDNYAPYTEASQTDPSGPANATDRVLCGGHWFNYSSGCRASSRSGRDSNYHSYGIGFRVARNP
jgi:formylglycine-generating enzyme required for sulfatase activity